MKKDILHTPHRGSDVETFIKRYRDAFPEGTEGWAALDLLLGEYRHYADKGLDLRDMDLGGGA